MIEVGNATIHIGKCLDTLKRLEAGVVQCCVTSPPYFGLRDYGIDGQLGLEPTPELFVANLVEVFREVRRVLADDGTLWLNLGDSYARQAGDDRTKATDSGMKTGRSGKSDQLFKSGNNKPPPGLKPKDLIGIPWMVAFALRADGWYLRSDIIWSKPNPMPESVTDRPTKAHEYIFLLSKSERYFYDHEAVKEQSVQPERAGKLERSFSTGDEGVTLRQDTGRAVMRTDTRNKRTVWEVATAPFAGAHFATFPPKLIEPCILAGSSPGDVILDPFNGSGTTGIVALKHDRKYIGCEINPEYVALTVPRLGAEQQQYKLAL